MLQTYFTITLHASVINIIPAQGAEPVRPRAAVTAQKTENHAITKKYKKISNSFRTKSVFYRLL